MGAFKAEDYEARVRYRNGFVWVLTIIPVILILIFEEPVAMVKAGGMAQALMLPVISIGALYLHRKKMPEDAKSGPLMSFGLWFASLTIIAAIGYYVVRSFIG